MKHVKGNEHDEESRALDVETVAGNESADVELARSNTGAASRGEDDSFDAEDIEDEPEGQLTIDVYQTPDEIVVESALAGVSPDDLDINVTNDSVTIRGRRRRNHSVRDEDYFYQECYWGRFARSVILPQEVDANKAYATFKNGILAVHMPKLSREKARKIRVKLE